MSIDTETSLETWELTLPEDEAGCEEPRGCDRSAEWRGLKDCGHHRLLCDEHRRGNIQHLGFFTCTTCGRRTFNGWLGWHRI